MISVPSSLATHTSDASMRASLLHYRTTAPPCGTTALRTKVNIDVLYAGVIKALPSERAGRISRFRRAGSHGCGGTDMRPPHSERDSLTALLHEQPRTAQHPNNTPRTITPRPGADVRFPRRSGGAGGRAHPRRHHPAVPDPGRDPAGRAGRPGHPRPRPHRVGQDARL